MSGAPGFEFLAEPVRNVLSETGISEPTPPQLEASPLIAKGENVLIVAPTGSGKTEAAILPLLSRLVSEGHGEGISILYITPLRALNRDMLRRLEFWCSRLGLTIDIRHGDTPQAARQRQSRNPPDLLVTTPETLQAILPGARMRRHLQTLKAVVVDELHNLYESKRGVQLCVGLERLRRVAGEFQLVALSATVGSPEQSASYIFGRRPHRVSKAAVPKEFKYGIEYPIPDAEDSTLSKEVFTSVDFAARLSTINDLLEQHNSALIFVNSRTVAEMLGEKLGRLRPGVGVHHGSLPREERERTEKAFKSGELKALVCTSTLELGIDIGSVDLVVLYMSPRQVTSLIQRVGRSGHSLRRISEGVVITVSPDDVLESAACVIEASKGNLEITRPHRNSLDVLAHQIAGYLMDYESLEATEILTEIRKASPYWELEDETFWRVVRFMNDLRKLSVDDSRIRRTRGTREYYFENLSMIPDETRYLVIDVATNQGVGILGEEFVLLQARVGLHFILKGKIWQVEKISDDKKVYVTPVEDPLAAVPGWDGEMLPIPFGLAQKTGELRRVLAAALQRRGKAEAIEAAEKELPASRAAVRLVLDELEDHGGKGAPIPGDDLVLLEGYHKYLIVHACFGEAVNRTLGYVFEELLSRKGMIQRWFMDAYRILFELTVDTADLDLNQIAGEFFGLSGEELQKTYAIAAQRNFPFPGRVKTIAERFGAIKRGRYISHPNLCSLPTRFESTPIFEEAIQETGRDLIDMERTKSVLTSVSAGKVAVQVFKSDETPTPIAYHILYRYLDVPELVAPDSLAKSTVQRMKMSIYSTNVQLLCLKCGGAETPRMIGELSEEPACVRCGSGLLSPEFWNAARLAGLVKKKLEHVEMNEDEGRELAKARRSADLVLSYGKRAVIALAVYGIGPQTASRILAKMIEDEDEFYKSLLEAKMQFITTRPFW